MMKKRTRTRVERGSKNRNKKQETKTYKRREAIEQI